MNCRYHGYDGYKIVSKIGEGSFSDVLKCQEFKTGSFYACKRLKKLYLSPKQMHDIPEIIALQKMGHHINVLHLIEAIYEPSPGYIIMVFEICDMSLFDVLKTRKRGLPENQVRDYTYQILRGLEFIHNSGIFHRDIKPENILLKGNVIKIADLGSVRGIQSRPPYTEYISTRWYRSPECLLTTGYYGPKMDVWAVGCVFYELLTLKPLFPGANEMDQINQINSIIGVPSTRTMEKFRKFKSYNYEWAMSWGKIKADVRNRSDHWGCGFHINKPRANIASTSLPSFHKYDQGSLGYFKLFSMLTRLSEAGRDVLKQMLIYDPDLRSSAHRALEHRYFNVHRELEITPRKYHCCSEIAYARNSLSGNLSKDTSVSSKESLPRKYMPKPTMNGDQGSKEYFNANKPEVDGMDKQNLPWHLPMLPAKYREKHVTDTSNCKGIAKNSLCRHQTSKAMPQGIIAKQAKKITLPKINIHGDSLRKCQDCNKRLGKCQDCNRPKPTKTLDNVNKPRQGQTERQFNNVTRSTNVNTNSILLKSKISLSPQRLMQNYAPPEAHKRLAQIGTSGLGYTVKAKQPIVLSKIS